MFAFQIPQMLTLFTFYHVYLIFFSLSSLYTCSSRYVYVSFWKYGCELQTQCPFKYFTVYLLKPWTFLTHNRIYIGSHFGKIWILTSIQYYYLIYRFYSYLASSLFSEPGAHQLSCSPSPLGINTVTLHLHLLFVFFFLPFPSLPLSFLSRSRTFAEYWPIILANLSSWACLIVWD